MEIIASAIWTPHQKIAFSTEADEFISKSEMPEHVAKCQALVALVSAFNDATWLMVPVSAWDRQT